MGSPSNLLVSDAGLDGLAQLDGIGGARLRRRKAREWRMKAYGIAAIVLVMLLKEAGVPVPIPSDLLMIITGVGFLTGTVSNVSIWLLETFPALQNLGDRKSVV